MKNIIELNEQISVGAKLICDKINFLLRKTNRNSKPGWKIRLETRISNLRQQVKMIREKKRWYLLERKEKSNIAIKTINLGEIKLKVPTNEGRQ